MHAYDTYHIHTPYMSPGLPQRFQAQGCPGAGPRPGPGLIPGLGPGSPGPEAAAEGLSSCDVYVCGMYHMHVHPSSEIVV